MIGCVLTVWFSDSGGPARTIDHRSMPRIWFASRNVRSTRGESPKPFIMPTDWEPWPGNTIASDISVFEEHGAPCEAAADTLQQHVGARPHAAVAHRDVERERDGGRGGVGVAVHGDDALR